MKNQRNIHSVVLLGSLAGTCLLVTGVFANPSMLPDHPGYPMQASKDPVANVSTANDPGEENLYGQKALDAAINADNQDMKLHSRASILSEEEKMEKKMEKMEKSMKTK